MWPFSRVDPKKRFWDYFAQNQARFRDPKAFDRAALDKLSDLLRAVQEGLAVEFTMEAGRAVEIVISADGRRELFSSVIDVVSAAPSLEGWRVSAFRQPGRIDASISFNGAKLGADDIWFRAEPRPSGLALVLHVRGMTAANHQQLGGAVILLLDNALGEHAVVTSIASVDFAALPADPAAAGLKPFRELPAAVPRVVH